MRAFVAAAGLLLALCTATGAAAQGGPPTLSNKGPPPALVGAWVTSNRYSVDSNGTGLVATLVVAPDGWGSASRLVRQHPDNWASPTSDLEVHELKFLSWECYDSVASDGVVDAFRTFAAVNWRDFSGASGTDTWCLVGHSGEADSGRLYYNFAAGGTSVKDCPSNWEDYHAMRVDVDDVLPVLATKTCLGSNTRR